MKKLILALLVLVSSSVIVKAQVQLTAYTGYQFGSRTYIYNGQFKVNGSQDFAGMLSFEIGPSRHIEISYSYLPTRSFIERGGLINEDVGDLDIHYYQIGGLQEMPVSDIVDLFGSFTLGGTTFSPKDQFNYNTQTFFSFTLGGGAKIWLTDVIGIRLQARLLMPITWGGFTIGTGGAGFTTGSSIISGDVGGGIVLKLGN